MGRVYGKRIVWFTPEVFAIKARSKWVLIDLERQTAKIFRSFESAVRAGASKAGRKPEEVEIRNDEVVVRFDDGIEVYTDVL